MNIDDIKRELEDMKSIASRRKDASPGIHVFRDGYFSGYLKAIEDLSRTIAQSEYLDSVPDLLNGR